MMTWLEIVFGVLGIVAIPLAFQFILRDAVTRMVEDLSNEKTPPARRPGARCTPWE